MNPLNPFVDIFAMSMVVDLVLPELSELNNDSGGLTKVRSGKEWPRDVGSVGVAAMCAKPQSPDPGD